MTGRTAIIGAGIVGVCSAIELQKSGHQVTLFDKGAPGQETSRWNAGVLASSSLIPLNNPGLFARLPGLITGRQPGLRLNFSAAVTTLPWAVRFLANARQARSEAAIAALKSLISHSRKCHHRLCGAEADSYLDARGWLMLYRGPDGHSRAAAQRNALHRHQVSAHLLDGDGLAELEPLLEGHFTGAVHIADSAFTDPAKLTALYIEKATGLGVRIEADSPAQLAYDASGLKVGTSHSGAKAFDRVVVAAGAWSNQLLQPLGLKLPMVVERGYLQSFELPAGSIPARPFLDVDGGYVAAPRADRVQISSGTELTTLSARPDPAQLENALEHARKVLSITKPVSAVPAVGNRPTLPDSLPAIGPVRVIPGLWLACGHQHIGLSTSAGTGHLLAAMMRGDTPEIDMCAFSPDRFRL